MAKSKEERAAYMRDYRRRKREAGGRKPDAPEAVTDHVHTGADYAPAPEHVVYVDPVTGRVIPEEEIRARKAQAQRTPGRRKRMKSDKEIKAYIANTMMTHGQNPVAFLNVMVGYVAQLQELMKRDREDTFAERACEHRHPGQLAQGVYCKLCHDAEMSSRFGSLPPEFAKAGPTGHEGGEFIMPGDDKSDHTSGEGGGEDDDASLFLGGIKPLKRG